MKKLVIGDKEYQLKFGYKATLKSRILSKMAKAEEQEQDGGLETLEDFLMFIPDVLLVALQKFHKEEFGFDVETGDGKEEMLDKAIELVEQYIDDGNSVADLYNLLSEELKDDSFLSSLFDKEKAAERKKEIAKKSKEAQSNQNQIEKKEEN